MADGFIFYVNGRSPNKIEFAMKKDYAKQFANSLLEAVDRMGRGENDIVFEFKGQPFSQRNAILSEIKENGKGLIIH